jgi:hypothetical protein
VSKIYAVGDRKINDCGALVERKSTGENKLLGENLPQCHFVFQKFHIT